MSSKKRLSPHLDRSLIDLPGEEWDDIMEYDGIYRVSNMGRVKSLGRYIYTKDQKKRWIKEKILKIYVPKSTFGDTSVKLSVDDIKKTYRVMALVADSFLRRKEEGEVVCRKNKVKYDSRAENLQIVPHSESNSLNYTMGVATDWGISGYKINEREIFLEENGIFDKEGNLVGQKCQKCGEERPISMFYVRKRGDITRRFCKICDSKRRGSKRPGIQDTWDEIYNSGKRRCSKCDTVMSLDLFGNCSACKGGKRYICKECVKVLNAKYNPLRYSTK